LSVLYNSALPITIWKANDKKFEIIDYGSTILSFRWLLRLRTDN
jgi:hypothetical protein